jgi:NAD(P)-dependent dehydrogenase (short-subunit alcohol dehydrogenase family)
MPRNRYRKALWIGAGTVGAAVAVRTFLARRKEVDLSGQVVLITGGSRGLGLALAREFARRGCRIALCARDRGELEAAAAGLSADADVATFVCNVSSQSEVERMIEEAIAHFGTIDILVNNAGDIQVGPVQSMTIGDFDSAMGVMFWGMVYSSMALLPHMLRRRSGRIVNITSIGGKVAVPHLLPYDCAKFAALGFSEGLHAELGGTGVKVTTIAPGLMRTGSYLNAWFKGDAEREAFWFGLGATLPGISMDARRAARQIVRAAARGEAESILSLPAKVLALSHGVFPGATAEALSWINRLALPSGSSPHKVRGRDTEVLHAPFMKALTFLGRQAARHLHEDVQVAQ